MTTPIIMLVLLTTPLVVTQLIASFTRRPTNSRAAAALGLGLLFLFTAIGHFAQSELMAQMLPPRIPQRELLVYLSGILEVSIAVGFILPKTRRLAGWTALTALLLFFPLNVYAAINRIPMGGHAWGPVYLWIRGPLQLIVIMWIYWYILKSATPERGVTR